MTTEPAAGVDARALARAAWVDVRAVLPAFVTARVLVAAAYVMATAIADRLTPGDDPVPLQEGLAAWDGTWYRQILRSGYDASPIEAVRFFPLHPWGGRAVAPFLGGRHDLALVVVANVAALLLAVLIRRLVLLERGDRDDADRSVWLICLFPSAFVLVWGYSEALMLAGAVGAFLAARSGRWWWAVPAATIAAASRPTGVLVVAALAIEALRDRRGRTVAEWIPRGLSVVVPCAATFGFLAWDAARSGEWLRPLTIQSGLRGDGVDPVTRLVEGFRDLAGGERFGDGLHAPFALVFIVLLVLCARWFPASYVTYAALVLVAALSAENLNSLERYGLNAFPLILTLAVAARPPWSERSVLAISTGGFVALCTMAWLGAYVP